MMKVVTKLLLTIETDVETGDIKLLNREVINDDIKPVKKKSTSSKVIENPEPIVTLADNKLSLTTGAMDLLKVAADSKVAVKYNKDGKPIIGSDEAFGTKTGNRVTKSNTISFKGDKYDRLVAFGTEFKLESTDTEGIFLMVNNKEEDLSEDAVDINSELDIPSLDNLDFSF